MTRVDPVVLQRLRKAKSLSQEQLAEKTKIENQPKINKQTISRLERGERLKTRSRTIRQLAHALGVDPAVLTGDSPAPDISSESSALDSKSQLNVRVGTASRNALNLVARRYRVEPSRIVELAPFLFACAAEESLRRRRERVSEVERACENARNLEREIRHFPVPNFTYSEEKIAAEHESIERRDLFGAWFCRRANFLDPAFHHNFETENPFAMFLRNLATDIGRVAKFEGWSGDGSPNYRVCPEEATELVGGDHDRADEILRGLVALNEMPKEIRSPDKAKERAEWVREKAAEYRKHLADELADLDRLLESRRAST